MRKINQSTLREKIVLEIKNAILSGEIPPHTVLVQEQIAQDLGVSRMPVREALLVLERDNFITFNATKKAVVLPFLKADIAEHYALRSNLESECAKAAARKGNDYTRLIELNNQMLVTDVYSEYLKLNYEFHKEIQNLSGLNKTVRLVENLWESIPPVIRRDHRKYLEKSNQEHIAIVKAITSNDEALAKQLMEQHILRSYEDYQAQDKTVE